MAEAEATVTAPEAEPQAHRTWVLNSSSDVYHLVSEVRAPDGGRRAVCGWKFERTEYAELPRAAPEPRWFWVVCSSCAPAFRSRLKAEAGLA